MRLTDPWTRRKVTTTKGIDTRQPAQTAQAGVDTFCRRIRPASDKPCLFFLQCFWHTTKGIDTRQPAQTAQAGVDTFCRRIRPASDKPCLFFLQCFWHTFTNIGSKNSPAVGLINCQDDKVKSLQFPPNNNDNVTNVLNDAMARAFV